MYNALYRILGSSDDAHDVAQDAFIQAFQQLKTFRGASSFYSWLFRIALNAAASQQRRSRRKVASIDSVREQSGREPIDQRTDAPPLARAGNEGTPGSRSTGAIAVADGIPHSARAQGDRRAEVRGNRGDRRLPDRDGPQPHSSRPHRAAPAVRRPAARKGFSDPAPLSRPRSLFPRATKGPASCSGRFPRGCRTVRHKLCRSSSPSSERGPEYHRWPSGTSANAP